MLANPNFLAGKAALASMLALGLGALFGNPDQVTATFVAVLCVSPTILMGLRRASAQLTGSLIGGCMGSLAMAAGLPVWLGTPAAIGAGIALSFYARAPMGHTVAAFSALVVQLVPRGGPLDALEIRMGAVAIAAVSGFLVNLTVSGLAYEGIFGRRLQLAEARVRQLFPVTARGGADHAQAAFGMLAQLQEELSMAVEELRWRRAHRRHAGVQAMARRAQGLRHLLHLSCELAYAREAAGVPASSLDAFCAWFEAPSGGPPPVDAALAPVVGRVIAELALLDEMTTTGR